MHFLKNHRRAIALVSAFAFFWFVQAGCLTLQAKPASSRQASVRAQPDQQPGAIEQEASPASKAAKKKSILPWILIGVGVVGASVALYFFVLKTNYDIRGTWDIVIIWSNGGSDAPVITFVGSKKSGTLTSDYGDTGPYSVKGKEVTWTFDWDTTFVWTGEFTKKDAMSGTTSWGSDTGTWTGTRTTAPAAVPAPKSWHKATR